MGRKNLESVVKSPDNGVGHLRKDGNDTTYGIFRIRIKENLACMDNRMDNWLDPCSTSKPIRIDLYKGSHHVSPFSFLSVF